MSRRLVLVIAAIALIASAGIAFAGGTPAWWNNPGGVYGSHQTYTTTGTTANTGGVTQLLTIIWDVPNVCPSNAAKKEVWQQISWNAPGGGVTLDTTQLGGSLRWTTAVCPPGGTSVVLGPNTFVPMSEQLGFTPPSGYANGWERSASLTFTPGSSPKCERIFTGFEVESTKSVEYKLEVQTVCTGPNAVSLRDLGAKSGAALPLVPAVGALSVLAIAPVVVLARRRRSSR
jgi:hypothetical protein